MKAKLVRDKIPDIIREKGKTPIFITLDNDNDYLKALLDKINEEAQEVIESNGDFEELSDLFTVIMAICQHKGYDNIWGKAIAKVKTNGAFDDRIFLMEVKDNANNCWAYYGNNGCRAKLSDGTECIRGHACCKDCPIKCDIECDKVVAEKL